MVESSTEIANMAISHLGLGVEIANLDTTNTPSANAARRFYATVRDELLEIFPWSFATKFAALGLVETEPDDDDDPATEDGAEYGYAFRYPSGCLKIRRLLSGKRNDDRQSQIVYKVGRDATGRLIWTDLEEAHIEYTEQVTDVSQYPASFVMALSYILAARMAPRLTEGDPYKLGDKMLRLAEIEITKAMASNSNEELPDEEPRSEFERARD